MTEIFGTLGPACAQAELLEHMVLEKGVPGQDNYTGILIACR